MSGVIKTCNANGNYGSSYLSEEYIVVVKFTFLYVLNECFE